MLRERFPTSRVLRLVVLIGAIAAWGVARSGAASDHERRLFLLKKKDVETYLKVTNLRMYVTAVLNENALDAISGEGSTAQVVEVSNWPHAPVQVAATPTKMNLRVRDEKDFIIIWYRRPTAKLPPATALDSIGHVTAELLADVYVLGDPDTLVGAKDRATAKSEIRLLQDAKVVEGTTAIACSYTNVSPEKRRWMLVHRIHVLLKGDNVIAVLEKLKARQYGDKYVYEGLRAAKVRLTKAEAERAKNEPVLAKNVVFDARTDVGKLSDALLNGCMWPVDSQEATGAKPLCPAVLLRPAQKPVTTIDKPSGRVEIRLLGKPKVEIKLHRKADDKEGPAQSRPAPASER